MKMFTTGVKEDNILVFLSSSLIVNKEHLWCPEFYIFDDYSAFLFEIVPENGAKELCIVTMHKDDVMCLTEC